MGFLPNWIPTFGVGPIISVALAKIFRANTAAALIGGVSGSFLWPFLFYLNYKVGEWIFQKNSVSAESVIKMDQPEEMVGSFNSMGLEFITGMIINCLVCAAILYSIFYILFKSYRLIILDRVKKM